MEGGSVRSSAVQVKVKRPYKPRVDFCDLERHTDYIVFVCVNCNDLGADI